MDSSIKLMEDMVPGAGSLNVTEYANTSLNMSTGMLNMTESPYPLSLDYIIQYLNKDLFNTRTYFYFLWYIIGLPSNLIAFLVWTQHQMVNSSGCYMAALAIPDNVFLILHATFSSIRWCPNCVMLTNYPVMCQLLPMLYTSTQCMSTLLVLMFTIEQFIAIRYPFKRSRYCRVSIAKKIIIGVTIFSLALGAPQAYFYTLHSFEGHKYCGLRSHVQEGDTKSVWMIWTLVSEMTVFGLTPLACLFLNIGVIWTVIDQRNIQITRNYSGSRKDSMRRAKISQATTTVMLLAVSLYWVLTELSATTVLIVNQAFSQPEVYYIEDAVDNKEVNAYVKYITVRTVVEVLSFSRYSCKFFIYLTTGKLFRKSLKNLMASCCGCTPCIDTTPLSRSTTTSRLPEDVKLISRLNSYNNNSSETDNFNGCNSTLRNKPGRRGSKEEPKWHIESVTDFTSQTE